MMTIQRMSSAGYLLCCNFDHGITRTSEKSTLTGDLSDCEA